jgi:hypothetical protein
VGFSRFSSSSPWSLDGPDAAARARWIGTRPRARREGEIGMPRMGNRRGKTMWWALAALVVVVIVVVVVLFLEGII